MSSLSLDTDQLEKFVKAEEIAAQATKVAEIHAKINSKELPGAEMLGWRDLPEKYDRDEFNRIKAAAEKIQGNSDVLVVVGIGGSYLGARAVISALTPNFGRVNGAPEVIYAGTNLSGKYLDELLGYIKDKDFSVNVISKSGTTLEPALAFRAIRDLMVEKYGDKSKERIFATTDKNKGALKELANKMDYETFVVPDDIGGRYSVLTAVGLLPIAAAGVNIDELMSGAADGMKEYENSELNKNSAYRYSVLRHILYSSGKKIELLANNEPNLHWMAEWWKQLFGESEGKNGKGLFPAAVDFTADLHSLGQYIQEGERHLIETVIKIKDTGDNLAVPTDETNLDELNYIAGKKVDWVESQAFAATIAAHTDGGVPNIVIEMDKLDAKSLGHLIYFFETACMMSAYLIDINPFNQDGVEAYKKNMFRLLGKPGN